MVMEFKPHEVRELDLVKESAQKYHVLSKYLLEKELTLRSFPFDQKFTILKIKEDGKQISVKNDSGTLLVQGAKITLYSILAKYIELECTVLKVQDDGRLILNVESLGISRKNREGNRVPSRGNVHINNIVTVKTVIDANMFQVPTLVKVAFDEFRSKLDPKKFEYSKIDIFKSDLLRKFLIVKKTRKIFFISDTQKTESYNHTNSDFLNFGQEIDDDIELEKERYREDRIMSECILPVLYGNPYDELIPIGYVHIQNRESNLNENDIEDLKKLCKEMVTRILESNTMQISGKFPVIDISPTGLQVQINEPNLVKILPKQKSFIFDIIFKLQTPFTVIGKIRWVAKKNDEDSILLGVELEGKSDLPGERAKYLKNIENLRLSLDLEQSE
ncbi:MAG: DUF1577 domain-containing protein [Leptospira sp.]|nr:DUF1577 domain-containing protein [Leptospira sp.]